MDRNINNDILHNFVLLKLDIFFDVQFDNGNFQRLWWMLLSKFLVALQHETDWPPQSPDLI